MTRPLPGTFPEHFSNYINQVEQADLNTAFENQQDVINSFFRFIPEEQADFSYAEGKWSLKEMLQHIIDAERIFCYRALCIARKETNSLPGFDEDAYAAVSNASQRKWDDLCDELEAVRKSTLHLFRNFSDEMLNTSGIANGKNITPLALGFITIGHLTHHTKVIRERYLPLA